MKAELLSHLGQKPLTVNELVDLIGEGPRCRKAAVALARRHLDRMIEAGLVAKEISPSGFTFRRLPDRKVQAPPKSALDMSLKHC